MRLTTNLAVSNPLILQFVAFYRYIRYTHTFNAPLKSQYSSFLYLSILFSVSIYVDTLFSPPSYAHQKFLPAHVNAMSFLVIVVSWRL